MDTYVQKDFMEKWNRFFPNCELPLAIFFTNDKKEVNYPDAPPANLKGYTCIFAQLNKVRKGEPRAFNEKNLGCLGAFSTLGFLPPNLDDKMINFLTKVECFKKSKEHVLEMVKKNPPIQAQGKYLVFKRWDQLEQDDEPQIVTFFANADVITALHALANYDAFSPDAVMTPFGSGCDTLIGFAIKELGKEKQKAVLGGLDPAMRNCVKKEVLTFSIPFPRFKEMIDNMDSSFINTYIWEGITSRLS